MDGSQLNIAFTLNGRSVEQSIHSYMLLIELIRDVLKLTGTKSGCMEGECGACSVLVDGVAINSCLYLAVNIEGKSVTTIEGVYSGKNTLDEVQQALVEFGAIQCGFCTPGMVMAIKSFKERCDNYAHIPSRNEIKENLAGNICRCTGYVKIIDSVESLFPQRK